MVKQSISDAARAYLEKKDNDTFAELYNAAKDTLYFHIYEKVKNRDIAEDLLQDTWMKILRSIDQLKSPDAFLSWAVTAANNTALDYLKNQTEKRHNAALSVTPSDGEGDNEDVLLNLVDDKLMLPENVMENEVLLKLVMDKLNTLSESQRKILYESAVNEKTDQVIASEFGMNPNTVKTTRRRAIQQFNKAMAGLADSRGSSWYRLSALRLSCICSRTTRMQWSTLLRIRSGSGSMLHSFRLIVSLRLDKLRPILMLRPDRKILLLRSRQQLKQQKLRHQSSPCRKQYPCRHHPMTVKRGALNRIYPHPLPKRAVIMLRTKTRTLPTPTRPQNRELLMRDGHQKRELRLPMPA